MNTKTEIKLSRRGNQLFAVNPFLGDVTGNTKPRKKSITNKNSMMMVEENTGEVKVSGATGFWYAEEVDATKFIKLYVNGVAQFKELTKAGTTIFHFLYLEMQKSIGKDKIFLSPAITEEEVSKSTYMRGIKELVDKKFLAESTVANWYFINPDYMFNGDRLAFIKEYRKKSFEAPKGIDDKTIDMFNSEVSDLEVE